MNIKQQTNYYNKIKGSLSKSSFEKYENQAETNRGMDRNDALDVNSRLVNQEEHGVYSDILIRGETYKDLDPESYANWNVVSKNWRTP